MAMYTPGIFYGFRLPHRVKDAMNRRYDHGAVEAFRSQLKKAGISCDWDSTPIPKLYWGHCSQFSDDFLFGMLIAWGPSSGEATKVSSLKARLGTPKKAWDKLIRRAAKIVGLKVGRIGYWLLSMEG